VTDTNREPDSISAEHPDLEVSVIIPARNEERSLPDCLASLLIQSEPGLVLGQQ
jgi:cellulose synthase/poly-beta-1,6-N-acetylglucosamine synthase-like glycosyltransferase